MFDQIRRNARRAVRISGWLCAVSMLAASVASAMPASPHPFTEAQPDGTRVELRLRGDEHFHWLEDRQGFTVVRERGRLVYGKREAGRVVPSSLEVGKHDPHASGIRPHLKPDASARAASSPGLLPSSSPGLAPIRTGTLRNLVIPIRFADHTTRPLPTREDLDVLFNRPGGDTRLAPTGSVRDVYEASSYGQLTLESVVVPWIDLPYTEEDYAAGNSGLVWSGTPQAIRAALAILDSDPTFRFSDFDRNGDGAIDAITFVHSGYGAEWGGSDAYGTDYTNRIWSHKWSMGGWFSDDGVFASEYHISPAVWGTSGSAIGRIGVISHELGHFLGLQDLYDTDYSGEGAGSFCLMANSWGFDGSQHYPPHMSAWSKMQLGWVTPTVITPGTYAIESAERSATVYRIDRGYPAGEYLLIENRQPERFDAKIPQGGLAIWHIDDRADYYAGSHYRVALLQADGQFGLENGWNRGDAGDLYHAGTQELRPDTIPNTDSYQYGRIVPTGNAVIGISAARPVMDFTFSDGTVHVPADCSDGLDNDGDNLVDFPADLGCTSVDDDSEVGPAACSDGVDNDGDRITDFPADPGCESSEDDSEEDSSGSIPVTGATVRVTENPWKAPKTGVRFKSVDPEIRVPTPGGPADPQEFGARVVISNPVTGENGWIELEPSLWTRGQGRLSYADERCSIVISDGRSLSVRCRGTLGDFTLDEEHQGRLDVTLALGAEDGYCASFGGVVSRDLGQSMTKSGVGSFSAKAAPKPTVCEH